MCVLVAIVCFLSATTSVFSPKHAISTTHCDADWNYVLWNESIHELIQQLLSLQGSSDEVIQLISSKPIIPLSALQLTVGDQLRLSDFYEAAINKSSHLTSCSQVHLVQLIKMMMHQNMEMNANLTVSVWNRFFSVYYEQSNHYPDQFFFRLLAMMKERGSNASPDIHTFNVILRGISTSKDIADWQALSLSVTDYMISRLFVA